MGQPANPVPMITVGVHPDIPDLEPTPRELKPKKRKPRKIRINKHRESTIKKKVDPLDIINKIFNTLERNDFSHNNIEKCSIFTLNNLAQSVAISQKEIEKYLKLIEYIKSKPKIYSGLARLNYHRVSKTYYTLNKEFFDNITPVGEPKHHELWKREWK